MQEFYVKEDSTMSFTKLNSHQWMFSHKWNNRFVGNQPPCKISALLKGKIVKWAIKKGYRSTSAVFDSGIKK